MANNKLTLGKLKTIDSKTYTQKKIKIGEYDVLIDEQFRPSKISEMITEFTQKLDYCREKGYDLKFGEYVFVLLIKYFTDITIPSSFEEQVQMLKLLVDHELLTPIINAFDENEMKKLNDNINKYKDNVDKLLEDLKAEQEEKTEEVDAE